MVSSLQTLTGHKHVALQSLLSIAVEHYKSCQSLAWHCYHINADAPGKAGAEAEYLLQAIPHVQETSFWGTTALEHIRSCQSLAQQRQKLPAHKVWPAATLHVGLIQTYQLCRSAHNAGHLQLQLALRAHADVFINIIESKCLPGMCTHAGMQLELALHANHMQLRDLLGVWQILSILPQAT